MPRKAKPKREQPVKSQFPTGQPISSPTGQPFGQRQALEDAQRDIPLPQAGPFRPTNIPHDPNAVVAAAQNGSMRRIPMTAPSNRPGEPVTAGLGVGPGPGPQAIPRSLNLAADMLDIIATATGDEVIGQLAERARLQG